MSFKVSRLALRDRCGAVRAKSEVESLSVHSALGYGHGSKSRTSEHPNPTTKIGSKMGGEFTYPKMGYHWF